MRLVCESTRNAPFRYRDDEVEVDPETPIGQLFADGDVIHVTVVRWNGDETTYSRPFEHSPKRQWPYDE